MVACALLPAHAGCRTQSRIGQEQIQHALQVEYISSLECEPSALDDFAVFGGVAGQHANTSAHGFQQS